MKGDKYLVIKDVPSKRDPKYFWFFVNDIVYQASDSEHPMYIMGSAYPSGRDPHRIEREYIRGLDEIEYQKLFKIRQKKLKVSKSGSKIDPTNLSDKDRMHLQNVINEAKKPTFIGPYSQIKPEVKNELDKFVPDCTAEKVLVTVPANSMLAQLLLKRDWRTFKPICDKNFIPWNKFDKNTRVWHIHCFVNNKWQKRITHYPTLKMFIDETVKRDIEDDKKEILEKSDAHVFETQTKNEYREEEISEIIKNTDEFVSPNGIKENIPLLDREDVTYVSIIENEVDELEFTPSKKWPKRIAKIDEDRAKHIRIYMLMNEGLKSLNEMAEIFHMAPGTLALIRDGNTWRDALPTRQDILDLQELVKQQIQQKELPPVNNTPAWLMPDEKWEELGSDENNGDIHMILWQAGKISPYNAIQQMFFARFDYSSADCPYCRYRDNENLYTSHANYDISEQYTCKKCNRQFNVYACTPLEGCTILPHYIWRFAWLIENGMDHIQLLIEDLCLPKEQVEYLMKQLIIHGKIFPCHYEQRKHVLEVLLTPFNKDEISDKLIDLKDYVCGI